MPESPRSGSSALAWYLADIRKMSRLTRKRERELARAIRNGRQDAVSEMVTSNLFFVVRLALPYRGLGLPLEDLLNEGAIGLIEAARRFDPERNVKFASYAGWWIRKSILKALSLQASLVRVPTYRFEKMREIREAEARLRQDLGREPTWEEVCSTLSAKPSRLGEQLRGLQRVVSLDEKVGKNKDLELHELLEDPASLGFERELLRREARRELKEAMTGLSEQEEVVIACRYGLDGDPRRTLDQVGQALGLSRERVRQIEARAKARLLEYLEKDGAKKARGRRSRPDSGRARSGAGGR